MYNVSYMKQQEGVRYLTIKDAAEFLGVSKMTLRRWDNAGKLKSKRHPMNNYRIYKKSSLELFLEKMEENYESKRIG